MKNHIVVTVTCSRVNFLFVCVAYHTRGWTGVQCGLCQIRPLMNQQSKNNIWIGLVLVWVGRGLRFWNRHRISFMFEFKVWVSKF